MLLFISADGSQWEPSTVIGGELTSRDVLAFARSSFPRHSVMMLYDASTCTRLRTDFVVKLEHSSTGHIQVVMPLLDAPDFRASDQFKLRASGEKQRVECLNIVFRCLSDNLLRQVDSIQRQVKEAGEAISRSSAEAEELGALMDDKWIAELSSIQCPNGIDAWSALALFPDSAERVAARIATVRSEFTSIAAEVEQEAQKQQQHVSDQTTRLDEAIAKFHRLAGGDAGGGVGSRNSAGGSAGSSGSSLANGGTTHFSRVGRIVEGFRRQSLHTIAQWKAIVNKLRSLGLSAQPTELKSVKRFAEELPVALEELDLMVVKRCGIAKAALAVTSQLEQEYLELVGRWSSWSAKYSEISEPLARAAPQCCDFKDLPKFLLPRNLFVPTPSRAGEAGAKMLEAIDAHCTTHLGYISDTLKLRNFASGGGSDSVSSPGLPSRQCTSTPTHHQFTSPADDNVGCISEEVKRETRGEVHDKQRISDMEQEMQVINSKFATTCQEHITTIRALENALTTKENELRFASETVDRLTAQLVLSEGGQSAASPDKNVVVDVVSTPFVRAMSYLEQHFQSIANQIGAKEAFRIQPREGEGLWDIPTDAPPLVACNHFAVRTSAASSPPDAPSSPNHQASTPPSVQIDMDNISATLYVTLHLTKEPTTTDGGNPRFKCTAEIHEGDLDHHINQMVLQKTCQFKQEGAPTDAKFTAVCKLPTGSCVRPDLRGKAVKVVAAPDGKRIAAPMTVVQVNSVLESICVVATCSTA